MRLIADPEMGGVFTAALAVDWGLPRTCQVSGCGGGVYAIACLRADECPDGRPRRVVLCRRHHDEGVAAARLVVTVQ